MIYNNTHYKTFESISRFAELLSVCRGKQFAPRITEQKISANTKITLIEPPCGSNTAIIESNGEVLFVDCGYALYQEEISSINSEYPSGVVRYAITFIIA